MKKVCLFLLLCFLCPRMRGETKQAGAFPGPGAHRYKAGQIWRSKAANGYKGVTVLILEAELKGDLVHIRLNDVPVPCGKIHVTTSIEHLAVSEKSLRQITTTLAFDNVTIPDSYFKDLRSWKENHGKTYDHPLAKVSVDRSVGDEICSAAKGSKPSKYEYTIYP